MRKLSNGDIKTLLFSEMPKVFLILYFRTIFEPRLLLAIIIQFFTRLLTVVSLFFVAAAVSIAFRKLKENKSHR